MNRIKSIAAALAGQPVHGFNHWHQVGNSNQIAQSNRAHLNNSSEYIRVMAPLPLLSPSAVTAACSGQFCDSTIAAAICCHGQVQLWDQGRGCLTCRMALPFASRVDVCAAVPLDNLIDLDREPLFCSGRHGIFVLCASGEWALLWCGMFICWSTSCL